ncbi:MAG: histidine triad nucleotide-binding protein [Acidobacteriaceae bacterium]
MDPTSDCIFCKIAHGQVPAKKAYEDEQAVAFYDLNPQAPTHLLVIPRRHIPSLAHATEEDTPLLGHLLHLATQLAAQMQLAKGFRIVLNSGNDGGQTVHHLHLHLLGGRAMHWPPG